jgi:hypothetical protein
VSREVEGVQIQWSYSIYLYGNRTMKPVGIVLRILEGVNLTKVHCK